MNHQIIKITVLYYLDCDLELKNEVITVEKKEQGRIAIPENFRRGKNIIAVIDGDVDVLNKIGDRILPASIAG